MTNIKSKSLLTVACLCFIPFLAKSQESLRDTGYREIDPVVVKAYFNSQALLGLTSPSKVLTKALLDAQQPSSLVSAMNTTAGVRMEERSPGSYRLALRGSMIRSPFGIRNTKIYLDEIPMTDASGNTYFNLLDPVGIQQIHVLKGPDVSLFGPNSGGVVRISPNGLSQPNHEKSILLQGGSYGMFHQTLSIGHEVNNKYSFSFDQAFLRSDGYREQTGLSKKYVQTAHHYQYNPSGSLKFLGIYSDLGYETPGGLTLQQYEENPQQARPAAGNFPSAVDQKAGIYNKTILGGLIHDYQFQFGLKHVISVFGSHTDFENPFITNYETRKEKNLGYRTYFSFDRNPSEDLSWEVQAGMELQKGWYHIKNHKNNLGEIGDLTDNDRLDMLQDSYFLRAKAQFFKRLTAEASLGLNNNSINFERGMTDELAKGDIEFHSKLMPRVALSYLLTSNTALRAAISTGYSTPTLSEVRSSDNQINTSLQAESGTNYEMGLRQEAFNRKLIIDLTAYRYNMENGIVRQLNEEGNEFFVNAGKIDQKGLEASILTELISPQPERFIQQLILSSNLTYQHYKFEDYQVDDKDFSGNKVTSIPEWMWVNMLALKFNKGFELNVFHNFTDEIPLNDANSVFADKYHLVQAKASWSTGFLNKYKVQFFIGADNVLNQKYSLGNDINALGNRYFNAAAPRNFYGGVKVGF